VSAGLDRFKAAGFETTLDAIQQAYLSIPEEHARGAEEHAPGVTDLVLGGITYTRSILRVANTDLLVESQLNALSNCLAQLQGAVHNLVATGDRGHAGTIRDSASSMVATVTTWPTNTRLTVANAPSFANALASSVESEVRRMSADFKRITQSVSKLDSEITAQNTRVSTLDTRLEDIRVSADSIRDALTNMQSTFLEDQETRSREHEAATKLWNDQLGSIKKTFTTEFNGFRGRTSTILEEHQESLDEQLGRARQVVQLITLSGTSNEYRNEAVSQRKTADTWRLVAIGLGSVALCIALFGVVVADAISLSQTIARSTVSLATLGLAGYSAAQSSRHRQREESAKQLELVLLAFDPFVQDLPEEARRALKEAVSQRLFSDLSKGTTRPEQPSTSDALSVAGQALDLLKSRLGQQ